MKGFLFQVSPSTGYLPDVKNCILRLPVGVGKASLNLTVHDPVQGGIVNPRRVLTFLDPFFRETSQIGFGGKGVSGNSSLITMQISG